MPDQDDIEKFVEFIIENSSIRTMPGPRKKKPDLVDKLITLELVAGKEKLNKKTRHLIRDALIKRAGESKIFNMKIHAKTRVRMSKYVPSFFHSPSELVRHAIWDVLFHEQLTGKNMSLWIPGIRHLGSPMTGFSMKMPHAMYMLIAEAIGKTTVIRSTGQFVRLAIIRYLKILDKITNGEIV